MSDGSTIDLWTTPWIPWLDNTSLRDAFNTSGMNLQNFQVVADLFEPGSRNWNVGLIKNSLVDEQNWCFLG